MYTSSVLIACLLLVAYVSGTFDTEACTCAKELINELWTINPMGEGQLRNILRNEVTRKIPIKELHYPTKEEFNILLYHRTESPYTGISPPEKSTKGVYVSFAQQLSNVIHDFVIKKLGGPPRFIIEVGSFIGSGAIYTWAPLVKKNNDTNAMVVCIDTWQGDVNMRLGENFQALMNLQHGAPRFYHQFLTRIVEFGLTDTIFPMPIASVVGARLLAVTHWKIDLIYVDSAHEIGETFSELILYFQLVRPGGMLMGDDYQAFPAVKHDVDLFVKMYGEQLIFEMVHPNQWSIQKKI